MGFLLVIVASGTPHVAQVNPTGIPETDVSSPAQPEPNWADRQELEVFVDAVLNDQMEKLSIPGAVFVFVKDGQTVLAKGYGYADLNHQTPVNPEKTRFALGSVSKLFTATAAMQLVEHGLVDLNEDINHYLNQFQLERSYSAPVTLAHLLTRTDGLDHKYIGVATQSSHEAEQLGKYLAAERPPRVRPPGEVIGPPDHSFALAGYLVEEASGLPFVQYVDDNILQPLGMTHSSFWRSGSSHENVATGYEIDYQRRAYRSIPSTRYLKILPAGGLVSTGTDMARFIVAHLQNGQYGNTQILNQPTAQLMHQQAFTNHPQLTGTTYGFIEYVQNNQRGIKQAGFIPGFSSSLFLMPDQNLGFFLAYNRMETRLEENFIQEFINHYYPTSPSSEESTASQGNSSSTDLTQYVGTYRYNHYAQRSIEKLNALFQDVQVELSDQGGLIIRGFSPDPIQVVEVQPFLFRSTQPQPLQNIQQVAFRARDRTQITHLFLEQRTFDKLHWYETTAFQVRLLIVLVLSFVSAGLAWMLAALVRRRPSSPFLPVMRLAHPWAVTVSALNVGFLMSFGLAIFRVNPEQFLYGIPPVFTLLLILPPIITLLTLALPIFALLAWREKSWTVFDRLHYAWVTLAAIAFIPVLKYWNLLTLPLQ